MADGGETVHILNVYVDELLVDMMNVKAIDLTDKIKALEMSEEIDRRLTEAPPGLLKLMLTFACARLLSPEHLSEHFFEEHPEYRRVVVVNPEANLN